MVLEKAGTQPLGTYIDRRQTTVAEWVALRPILGFYGRKMGCEGGGGGGQTASIKQLSAMIK